MPFQFRKEAIEEDLNSNFPSQGQGNPPLYYSLSEVVVPTYSINNVAEGSSLPQMLQTAWDFSTGNFSIEDGSTAIISNPGFWLIDVQTSGDPASSNRYTRLNLSDGITTKPVYNFELPQANLDLATSVDRAALVVFVNSGQTLTALSNGQDIRISGVYRQIATLNGTLVNPLGYSAA